ncbi:MAG: hypothetical protein WC886_08405, partial [Saccharofermentanaceae bacterium]
MRRSYFNHIICLLAMMAGMIFFLSAGCRKQAPILRVNPAFREYIQAFTSGMISTRSVIKVRLADDFADTVTFNMPVSENYFHFKPSIQGKTYWTDSRTLEFHPDKPLPQDQVYTIEFQLSKLIAVPDSLKTMVFQVQTMKQEVTVTVDNHKAVSHSDLSREYLTGTLLTSDVADDQPVENILKARQDGRDLPIIWSHDKKNRSHIFQVDSIRRTGSPGEVKLEYDGASIDSKSEGALKIGIPSLGDFKMISIRSFPAEQPCIMIQFSDPLKSDQNLDGLFRVGKYQDLKYAIDDNLLWIYLPEAQDKKVRVSLEPAIRNIQQKELGKRVFEDVQLENTRPGVRFIGDGVILPSSNGMLLPFEAVNLNAVDIKVVRIFEKNILQFLQVNELSGNSELARVGRIVLKKTMPLKGVTDYGKWNRFSIDLSTLMKTEPGAIYSVILGFKKEYSMWPCTINDSLQRQESEMSAFEDPEKESDKDWGYYSNYYDDDFNNGGWRNYKWEERDNP